MNRYAHITGWGSYAPQATVTNDELAQVVPTSDEWIYGRTGVRTRHVADMGEHTSVLATKAAQKALEVADLDPTRLDLIIVATSTPDYLIPSTACLVQNALGARNAGAFDLLAACTGFLYGLSLATSMIRTGGAENVLIVGAEVLSHIMDWTDRGTCILFGDGAGAVVLQASDVPGGVLGCKLGADGSGADLLSIKIGARYDFDADDRASGSELLYMNGHEVFRFASRILAQTTKEVVAASGLDISDIDLLIPHQANTRILQSGAKQLGLPMEKVFMNLDRYGNTSAASVPLALVDAVSEGRIHAGDRLALVGFGGGLTWGACIVEWTYSPEDRAWPVYRRGLHWARYRLARARGGLSWLEHRLELLEDRVRRRDLARQNGRPRRTDEDEDPRSQAGAEDD